ncbi:palmdelphin-like [Polyodon spathula]|uniref:palmdelphin-like n=1 Tax=Polyodon spathula TaxID=7913 RepID=UPI001B7E84B0|nr:palmdelphin-like [Polyodon spathula]XP_041127376.1 palmdelphin-like [Polyodon spathula]
MEEAELLKERLHAITDKRRIQEDIGKKRIEIEEEKLKLQYLKKKSLREKWLMDGLSAQSPQEQEEIRKQAQDDQQQTKLLERNIHRMENEIKALEQHEVQISTKEGIILKRLKVFEKSPEDIIKAVKAEAQKESIAYVYSEISDLPKSYKPSKLKKMASPESEADNDQSKQALFAMEINVQKDMKTGESQILSTATVSAEEFKEKGIKVYDDGRKSIFAVHSDGGNNHNGLEELSPVEVEELLRKATEKKSALEYHKPVFSSPYSRPSTPKKQDREQISPEPNSPQPNRPQEMCGRCTPVKTQLHNEKANFQDGVDHSSHFTGSQMEGQKLPSGNNQNIFKNGDKPHMSRSNQKSMQIPHQDPRENHCAAVFLNSGYSNGQSSLVYQEDTKCNILHPVPTNVESEEPVTMIFMGYQSIEDQDEAVGFEGAIRAELVVIDDDDDNDDDDVDHDEQPSYHPDGQHSKVSHPAINSKAGQCLPDPQINLNMNNRSPYINSVPLQEKEPSLTHSLYHMYTEGPMTGDGTDDPSVTALRLRMAKLGKRMM